ncbi:MAG TPA: CoB--CoM heterodisulfide reductase iron-sulfur subunit A family protein [Bacteroidales bacterium]|jgi:heterodisulfide reductase subunit A|nr:CoB--CoM heterodisulfide reductase iron-sulfur subunit A family protein [Bacteroidales bacterium]HQJ80938.1 CoB--CoM heterodisulfide reductase iron-sulfur subunit A family protein [Bacteroidales bacterium]
MNRKIGVYICHCGGNISDYVDVEKVKQAVVNDDGVFLAKTTMFACGDANQKEMVEDIRNNGLDGVIVASCSPKLHLLTFRAVSERAGLNKYNYVHANIREQVSWAHSDNKAGATDKAIQIVKSAIAKVRLAEPLMPFRFPAVKAVAIAGGGISGMRAALGLSDMGCPVYLIEKSPFFGGRTSQWDVLYTSGQTGGQMVSELYGELLKRENVKLLTGAEIISGSGNIGDFKLKVRVTPRYVPENCNGDKLNESIAACPVELPDEFNFNLTKRKAIYRNHPGQFPQTAVIDMTSCTRCGECEKICPEIDLSQEEEIIDINAGSVLVATGFDPYTPADGEFGYGLSDRVITLPEFKRLIELNDSGLVHKGRRVRKIAYIYCVGSRQPEGDNKYCSRYCCTSVIHSAIQAKKKFGDITGYHFTRGIRTYGKQELLYAESLKGGEIYLQSYEDDPPVVEVNENSLKVRINDILTGIREVSVEPDLVVLVTGMVPRADNSVGALFKLPKGRDSFFNEIHMKLRPVETVIDGIIICGACQGPKNITESVNSALSAAVKSFSLVNRGELEMEPIVATIDEETCEWCGACYEACPFDAIRKTVKGTREIAEINNSVCKGCGICLPVCPVDAIELTAYSNREIESMIDALAGSYPIMTTK